MTSLEKVASFFITNVLLHRFSGDTFDLFNMFGGQQCGFCGKQQSGGAPRGPGGAACGGDIARAIPAALSCCDKPRDLNE